MKLEMGVSFTLIIHALWDLVVPFDSCNFIMKTSYKMKKYHPQKTADMGSSGNGIQIPGLIR